MKNKINAIVTGGASGLGEATVRKIIINGGNASIIDSQEEKARTLVDELGDACSFCKTDVTNEESVNKALISSIAKYKYINLVVNCAGIGIAEKVIGKEKLHETRVFQKVINVNLIGSFNVLKLAAEKMLEKVIGKNLKTNIRKC